MVECTRCQRTVKRFADGTISEVYKCTNGMANTCKKIISDATCNQCALRQTWDCLCSLIPLVNPLYVQPTLGQQSELIYVNGTPPCPYGYVTTDNPLVFVSEWPDCLYRETANELNADGSIKIKARCAITKKLIDPQTCKACSGDINSIIPKEYPAITTELTTYVQAVKGWVAAGRPVRTDEEVANIHTQYCTQCDWYDPDQQRCKGCGCKATADGAALLNKIKMGTQHCPKQLW